MLKKLAFISVVFLMCIGVANAQEVLCGDGIDNDGDGLIDCFDGDCAGTVDCDGHYYSGDSSSCVITPIFDPVEQITHKLTSQINLRSQGGVVVGDFDFDGEVEAIGLQYFSSGTDNLVVVNLKTGAVESGLAVDASNSFGGCAVADVDGNGSVDIFYIDSARDLYRTDGDLQPNPLFSSPTVGYNGWFNECFPSFADFNEDGELEVYVGNQIWSAVTGLLYAQPVNGHQKSMGAQNPDPTIISPNSPQVVSIAADVLPDAFCADCDGLELVCGNVVYSINDSTGSMNEAVHMQSLPDGFTSLADITGDGNLEVIISSITDTSKTDTALVYAYSPLTQSLISANNNPFRIRSHSSISNNSWSIGLVTLKDIDGDGKAEMFMCGDAVLTALDDNMNEMWSILAPAQSWTSSPQIFDFNGDGVFEVLSKTDNGLYLHNAHNGALISYQACQSNNYRQPPIIAATEIDGSANIICACNGVDPLEVPLRVFDGGANKWVKARPMWNERVFRPETINQYFIANSSYQNPMLLEGHNQFLGQAAVNKNFGSGAAYVDIDCNVLFDDYINDNWIVDTSEASITPYAKTNFNHGKQAMRIQSKKSTGKSVISFNTVSPEDPTDLISLDFEMVGDNGGEVVDFILKDSTNTIIGFKQITLGNTWGFYDVMLNQIKSNGSLISKLEFEFDSQDGFVLDFFRFRDVLREDSLRVSIDNLSHHAEVLGQTNIEVTIEDSVDLEYVKLFVDGSMVEKKTDFSISKFEYDFGNILDTVQVIVKAYNTAGITDMDVVEVIVTPFLSVDDFVISNNPTYDGQIRFMTHGRSGDFSIIDATGKLIYSGELDSVENIIDLGDVSKGFYFLRISADQEVGVKKIIVK